MFIEKITVAILLL